MDIAIIGGRGKMGQLFANFFKSRGHNIHIIGRQTENFSQLIRLSDVIILSVPLLAVEGYLTVLRECDLYNKVVINFASNMSVGFEQLKSLGCTTCCMHAMFGPDIVDFANQNIIVAPKVDHPKLSELIYSLLDASANVSYSTPEYHDKMMAVVQALSQFSSIALAHTISQERLDVSELKRFSTVTFRSNLYTIERILKQPAELWSAIQFQNQDFFGILDTYREAVRTYAGFVEKKDESGFQRSFENIYSHFTDTRQTNLAQVVQYGSQYIGTLGPRGTFSHQAALQYNSDSKVVFCASISEVLERIHERTLHHGLVPFENSLHGVVVETLEGIRNHDLFVKDQLVVPISHCIAGVEMAGEYSRITEVYSHPQALGQCSRFLQKYLPHAKKITVSSTSAAFEKIAKENLTHAVAIGPKLAAQFFGLNVYEEGIEDDKSNVTEFFVVSAQEPTLNGDPKKVIMHLSPESDRSGLLCDILSILKKHDVNLSMIESRPSKKKFRLYTFYVMCETMNSPQYQKIVAELDKLDVNVTFMGCF